MQNILSIDISGDIAIALICAVEGTSIRVLERAHVELGDAVTSLISNQTEQTTESEEENSVPEEKLSGCLITLLSKLTLPYTNIIVTVPSSSYLSLNLALPFNTTKNINKVLDFEIQDITPLEPSEFLIYPKALVKKEGGDFDVHVSMLPKNFVSHILKACRAADIEPYIITTVTSVVAAAYLLAPSPLSGNSIFVYIRNGVLALTAVVDGAIRYDRVLAYDNRDEDSSNWGSNFLPGTRKKLDSNIIQDLKLTIKSLEEKFQTTFTKAYLFDYYFSERELNSLEVAVISIPALIKGASDDDIIPAMASVFAEDYDAPSPLANFRTGELRYHYQFKELFKGVRKLVPLTAILISLIVIFTYIVYQARETKIAKIQNELKAEISKVVPNSSKHSLEEISEISDNIEKELNSLGMSSIVSPMQAFTLISEDISNVKQTNKELDITKLDITQNSAFILATAPTYNDFDIMKSVLKQRKHIYCSVKFNQKNSHPKRQAEFAIDFCKK